MSLAPERIVGRTTLLLLAALAAAGAAVAIAGLLTTAADQNGAQAAYVAGLALAMLSGLLLVWLAAGRRRDLTAARVRAAELERCLNGRAEPEEVAAADALVGVLVRAGAYDDAERLSVALAMSKTSRSKPVRLGAAAS